MTGAGPRFDKVIVLKQADNVLAPALSDREHVLVGMVNDHFTILMRAISPRFDYLRVRSIRICPPCLSRLSVLHASNRARISFAWVSSTSFCSLWDSDLPEYNKYPRNNGQSRYFQSSCTHSPCWIHTGRANFACIFPDFFDHRYHCSHLQSRDQG
jgi:hypothetical protein